MQWRVFLQSFFGIWNEAGNAKAMVHHKANGREHKEWHVVSERIAVCVMARTAFGLCSLEQLFALQER